MGILSVGFRRLRRRNDAGRQEGEGSEQADVPFALGLKFNAPILINKKKQIIAGHGRVRLRTTHKANELLTRAGVIADHAEQAAGGQRGSERVHTA